MRTRLTEKDLSRIVKKIISEQPVTVGTIAQKESSNTVPDCFNYKKPVEQNLLDTGGTQFEFPGEIGSIIFRGSVAPEYRGIYIIGKDGKEFCFFKQD